MCGIFGVIHNRKSRLNKAVFNALGIINDTRGGDSCGIVLDTEVEYGVDKYKLYQSFFLQSALLRKSSYCNFAFGHCRKASVGGISLETAQPVVIKEGEETKFVLIHNGTICNYKELAKEYIPNIDITGLTDSQVMAQIFYNRGYDVLLKYIGAGAFVTADFRSDDGLPVVRMFKGLSKNTEYSKEASEERPLFITKEQNCMWFSSIFPMLAALRYGTEVYTVTPNTLYVIKGSSVVKRLIYDRSNLWQTESRVYTSSYFTKEDYYAGNLGARAKSWIDTPFFIPGKIQYFPDGLFHIDNKLADGVFSLNSYGTKCNTQAFSFEVSIFEGVLLYNKACYDYLHGLCEDVGLTHKQLLDMEPGIVWKFGYLPKVYDDPKRGISFKDVFMNGDMSYTGELPILFCTTPKVYNIQGGFIKYFNTLDYTAQEKLVKDYAISSESFDWDFSKEYKKALFKLTETLCQE